MPSSHAASSPSKRQATNFAQQSSYSATHHQTVYNDDRGHCIVDRRSKVVRTADRSKSGHMCQPAPPSAHATLIPSHRSAITPMDHHFARTYPFQSLGLAPHVTSAKRSFKSEVVVHTAVATTSKKLPDDGSRSKSWEEPTPPPTPRLGRLPTPDISDLEEGLFCGCDSKANIVDYCKSCKKCVVPFPSLF